MDQPKPEPQDVSPTPAGSSQFGGAGESRGPVDFQNPSAISVEPTGSLPIRLVTGGIGGLLAAIIGGLVWALIAKFANSEWSAIALLIGFGCGYGVNVLSQGSKGILFQLTAAATSVFGIFLGKYLTFYLVLKEIVAEDFGAAVASEVSVLSLNTFQYFMETLGELLGFYDILWIGFAIYGAWRILQKD